MAESTVSTDPERLPHLDVEFEELDNGLRVNLVHDPKLPLVAVNVWYHVGSRFEQPGHTGLAHLFEHMLFQGSQHVGTNDHFRYVQQVGGTANGSTWFDRTNYYETLPSHCLELGLWLESDRMGFLLPALTDEKLENQRQVVMNERRQRIDNQPYGRAFERLNELLYPEPHPYHWPVIGYMGDIAAATLADVRSFFSTNYAPDNAVLTLAGDFDAAHARAQIERFFGEFPPSERPGPPRVEPVSAVDAGLEVMSDRVQLERSYIGFRTPPYGSREWYAADLLAAELTAGKASRLYRDLVYDRQLAQDVSAFALPTELDGAFMLVATASETDHAAEIESRIAEHLAAIAGGDMSDAALDRARNQSLNAYFEALQSLDHRADVVSQFTTYLKRPNNLLTELETYMEMQPAELSRVAARYLDPAGGVIVRVVPESDG
jgi:zinc protease